MFVHITDYHGNAVSIDPLRVLKIRSSGIADEPRNFVFIDYVSGGTFAEGSLSELVRLFGAYIRLAPLHAPSKMPIYLNTAGIASVDVDDRYDGNSVAIVAAGFENSRVPARNKIALLETPNEAAEILENTSLNT